MYCVGVDILYFARLRPLDGQWQDPFFLKTFTSAERCRCEAQPQPLVSYAGLFAAKEAVFKALDMPPDKVRLQHIEILHGDNGQPLVSLLPPLARMVEEKGISRISLSISYETDVAVAFAMAE